MTWRRRWLPHHWSRPRWGLWGPAESGPGLSQPFHMLHKSPREEASEDRICDAWKKLDRESHLSQQMKWIRWLWLWFDHLWTNNENIVQFSKLQFFSRFSWNLETCPRLRLLTKLETVTDRSYIIFIAFRLKVFSVWTRSGVGWCMRRGVIADIFCSNRNLKSENIKKIFRFL